MFKFQHFYRLACTLFLKLEYRWTRKGKGKDVAVFRFNILTKPCKHIGRAAEHALVPIVTGNLIDRVYIEQSVVRFCILDRKERAFNRIGKLPRSCRNTEFDFGIIRFNIMQKLPHRIHINKFLVASPIIFKIVKIRTVCKNCGRTQNIINAGDQKLYGIIYSSRSESEKSTLRDEIFQFFYIFGNDSASLAEKCSVHIRNNKNSVKFSHTDLLNSCF